AEWRRGWKLNSPTNKVDVSAAPKLEDRTAAIGAPRFAPTGYDAKKYGGTPVENPDNVQVYAEEFPFQITTADLRRGQERYTIYCASCHGPLGNGKGKIWERGYLKPTSYHTQAVAENEPAETAEVPLGFSRGYWRWGIRIPVREVPPGYVFEVITKGYGAMPDHAAQIPPTDRWRIVAYVRALQLSQHADPADPRLKP